ncbi:MAG: hypothetical protein LH470_03515 [Lysobacter sp.]|nr:hypothetical protein [Lysobacter sp.]
MNNSVKFAAITLAIGSVFAASSSQAALVTYVETANAPSHCQAFTPGVSNTIRNRVVGSENIGTPIAVACAYQKPFSATSTAPTRVELWFSNNTTAAFTVNCTLLTGWQGATGAVAVNKSVSVPASSNSATFIAYTAADTPSTTDTDLGFDQVGVNCTLPTGAVINDSYVSYQDENGV